MSLGQSILSVTRTRTDDGGGRFGRSIARANFQGRLNDDIFDNDRANGGQVEEIGDPAAAAAADVTSLL